jgi:hypothetical protein
MKTNNFPLICVAITAIISIRLSAQPSETVAKEKMKPLASWAGDWEGQGSMQMGPGEPKKSIVAEHLEFRLDGAVLVMEGIGKSVTDNSVVHHALGILSFDQSDNQYKFRSYLKDGRSTQAWFKIVVDNQYQWGFDTPNGKIKYSITIDPVRNTWNEIGEISNDNGATYAKFFEMNLKKR